MESFLNRYRNITVLLLVIFAQLVLLAVQVKNDQDVRFIRAWTVTAISPLARLVEALRGSSIGFVRNYITLHDADAENRRLKAENDRYKLEIIFLNNELNTADRAQALELFQKRTPSKTLAASVFSTGIGSSRKVVYVDRGTVSGVMREMAVVTPEGIVGKVTAVYPTASEVLLITDPEFAAGVVSARNHVHGTLKGTGTPLCKVDFVAFEDRVEPGDWFYTSGDDRIFPRGMPVGVVKSVRPGQPYREITLEPSGMGRGLEDVLIVVEGVHQEIPDTPPGNQPVYIAPPAPSPSAPAAGVTAEAGAAGTGAPEAAPATTHPLTGTEADKMRAMYQNAADAAGIVLGGGPTGQVRTERPPDFTKLPVDPRAVAHAAPAGRGAVAPMPLPAKGAAPAEGPGQGATLPAKGTAPLEAPGRTATTPAKGTAPAEAPGRGAAGLAKGTGPVEAPGRTATAPAKGTAPVEAPGRAATGLAKGTGPVEAPGRAASGTRNSTAPLEGPGRTAVTPAKSTGPVEAPGRAATVPRKSTAPPVPSKATGPTDPKVPDAVRHANQAAGGPGGVPQP